MKVNVCGVVGSRGIGIKGVRESVKKRGDGDRVVMEVREGGGKDCV